MECRFYIIVFFVGREIVKDVDKLILRVKNKKDENCLFWEYEKKKKKGRVRFMKNLNYKK